MTRGTCKDQTKTKLEEKKKSTLQKRLYQAEFEGLALVEMAGIEPASEKASSGLSTGVAFVLTFPLPSAQKQALGFSSL